MPRCPNCRRTFRTLPDEDGMHDCPFCGFGPELHADYEIGPQPPDPDPDPEPHDADEPDNDEPPRSCTWCGVTFTESGDCGCCADDYEHDDERQSAR